MSLSAWEMSRLIPQAVVVELLNSNLGAGKSWSRWLDEERRYSRRKRFPVIPVHKFSGRCFYMRDDVLKFVANEKRSK